jgi:WD40 repeat protein
MKQLKIIGLILALSPVGQLFGAASGELKVKKIRTSDDVEHDVPLSVLRESLLIGSMLDALVEEDEAIILSKVSNADWEIICHLLTAQAASVEDFQLEAALIISLFKSIDYLDIPDLFVKVSQFIAHNIGEHLSNDCFYDLSDFLLQKTLKHLSLAQLNEIKQREQAKEETERRLGLIHNINEVIYIYKDITLVGHTGLVNTASFSPEGGLVVTASDDHTAKIWDAETGASVCTLGHTDKVSSSSFSPNGRLVVTASLDHTAKIWNAATGALVCTLAGHTGPVFSASFSPNGAKVVTTSSDKTARICDVATGALVCILAGHTHFVASASFSPNGRQVATASFDRTANIWDATTGALLRPIVGHTGWVMSTSFSPDERLVVTVPLKNTVRIWNAATGASVCTLGHTDRVSSASFSPNGRLIVTGSWNRTARIWNVETGTEICILGHTGPVSSASFGPNGRLVVTVSNGATVKIWKLCNHLPR